MSEPAEFWFEYSWWWTSRKLFFLCVVELPGNCCWYQASIHHPSRKLSWFGKVYMWIMKKIYGSTKVEAQRLKQKTRFYFCGNHNCHLPWLSSLKTRNMSIVIYYNLLYHKTKQLFMMDEKVQDFCFTHGW